MATDVAPCQKHPSFSADQQCSKCGAPICAECVRMFGQFCGSDCLNAAHDEKQTSAATAQRAAADRAEQAKLIETAKKMALGVGVLLLAGALIGVWKIWLHPYGKVLWTIASPDRQPEGNRIIRLDPDRPGPVLVKLGSYLVAADFDRGKSVWEQNLEEQDWPYVQEDSDGLLIAGRETIQRLGADGKQVWQHEFGKRQKRVLGHSAAVALIVETRTETFARGDLLKRMGVKIDREAEDQLKLWPEVTRVKTYLAAVSVPDGKDLWVAPAPANLSVTGGAVGPDLAVAAFQCFDRSEQRIRLFAFAPLSGERKWQLNLGESPAWGPAYSRGQFLYLDSTRLHQFSTSGEVTQSLAWDATTMGTPDELKAAKALKLVFSDAEALTRDLVYVDLKKGKRIWTFKLPGGVTSYGDDGDRVYLTGHTSEEGGIVNEHFDGASEALGLDGALGAAVAASATVDDWVLVCLQRENGVELWRQPGVSGRVACGDGRLVVIQDTHETSPSVRSANQPGTLVLYQYNPDNGRSLYSRRHDDLALEQAMVRGNHLIAFGHERVPFKQKQNAGARCLGLTAIRLK